MGPVGLYQHAIGPKPNPAFGACTDDVARAAMIDVAQSLVEPTDAILSSIGVHLHFLEAAFDPKTGRFRNVRDRSGAWDPAGDSDDAHARAIRALADVATRAPEAGLRTASSHLLERALPAAATVVGIRPLAQLVLAGSGRVHASDATIAPLLAKRVEAIRDAALTQLIDGLPPCSDPWPWPEGIVTYENGVIPEALLAGGHATMDRGLIDRGVRLLGWLDDAQTAPEGHARPIGNHGWWPRDDAPARFDQQPIDPWSMVAAAARAVEVTGEPRYADVAQRHFDWFLGHNDVGVTVALPGDGACHDGLGPTGVEHESGCRVHHRMARLGRDHASARPDADAADRGRASRLTRPPVARGGGPARRSASSRRRRASLRSVTRAWKAASRSARSRTRRIADGWTVTRTVEPLSEVITRPRSRVTWTSDPRMPSAAVAPINTVTSGWTSASSSSSHGRHARTCRAFGRS